MQDKELGDINSIHGVLVLNGIPYRLFVMKDAEFNMKTLVDL
jgi:hypothetical protein